MIIVLLFSELLYFQLVLDDVLLWFVVFYLKVLDVLGELVEDFVVLGL